MATVELPLQLDLTQLSSFLQIPAAAVESLASSPTTELVRTLLESISARGLEHERLQSENIKLGVELENALLSGDSRSRALKGSVEKGLREISELRHRVQDLENQKLALQSELQATKSSSSSSTSEIDRLNSRIVSLEASNRDKLSLLEAKSNAHDELANEVSSKHQKIVELRRGISQLEDDTRQVHAAASAAKFREQSLGQEIDSVKRNNEWLEQELKTKTTEYAKFRKDKSARLAELQRKGEEDATTIESMRRTEQSLRTRLDDISQKADEFLAQTQQLGEEASRQEENFRAELDTANRLAELMKASMETERQRQQDLNDELERAKDEAAAEISRITSEVETEHHDRVAAEDCVATLEARVERLESELSQRREEDETSVTSRSLLNGSPARNVDLNGSPSRLLSPRNPPGKGSISRTQLITELHNTKADFEVEKRRSGQLAQTVDEMLKEMEAKGPEIAELQADHGRLEADVLELSSLVDAISTERDQARKDGRKWEGQVAGLVREGDVLRQQLRDLSAQIKILLMEMHSQSQGLDDLTPDQRTRLEQIARGTADGASLQELTATDLYISQNMTTFRNLAELQDQNTKLLRVARELGHRMEGEEAQREKSLASKNLEELDDLRQRYDQSKDEIKVLVTQSQSYIRERDMFRRMLSHRGQLPPGSELASTFGDSVDGNTPATPQNRARNGMEQTPSTKDLADYAKLLKEMQSHFDNYRQEAATDRSLLKEQLDNSSKKLTELRSEVSRKTGEISITVERYEMLKGNYAMLKNENHELQRRSQSLSESAGKQDLKTQQVAEDLIEAKGQLDSMRNELANLKAEKEFWRTVEKRLTEDHANLTLDRDRLNTLNANFQNLLNEREQADSETRRRLQSQVESTEIELQAARRKGNDEAEENKRVSLQRAFDHQQFQTRIDDLVSSLGATREELVAAKTSRDHLQARVEEMTVELRSAEERLAVFQSRPSAQGQTGSGENSNVPDISREQELALEVFELRRDLDLVRTELESARSLAEQYKAISQSSEEELQSLNDTQDQYRLEMDRTIEEKESKIRELSQAIENLGQEISSSQSELSILREEGSKHGQAMSDQKATYENELARLKDRADRADSATSSHQQDLKAQAEIAQQAQQSYENELVKHAEAAKTLQAVRADFHTLKLEVAEIKAERDAARANFAQSEESWAEARDRYEQEFEGLKTKREDLNAQNKILHEQLESFGRQITSLQHHRTATLEEVEGDAPLASGTENLQELIGYLRREKEIVDVQLALSSQEAKRLRHQLGHTQTQLEDARLKLNQQRRAEENSERSALNYNKLMETVNELNLNRESNATLRLEKTQAQSALAEKLKIIEDLQGQLQPLTAKIRELEDAHESQEEELRMTREARERFEQRYHDVLHKSDNIDPAEVEALREEIESLRAEHGSLTAAKDSLQGQVDEFPAQLQSNLDQAQEQYAEQRQRMIKQSKDKARDQNAIIRTKDTALQDASQQKEELENQLSALRIELDSAIAEKDAALAQVMQYQQSAREAAINSASEDGQVQESESTERNAIIISLQEQLTAANSRATAEVTRVARMQEEFSVTQVRVSEQSKVLEQRILELEAAAGQTGPEQQTSEPNSIPMLSNEGAEEMQQLRQQLAASQEAIDSLNIKLSVSGHASEVAQDNGAPSTSEQIASQVRGIQAELTVRHEQRIQEAQENFLKRTELMKSKLNKALGDYKSKAAKETEVLKLHHSQEIEELNQRHQRELAELRKHLASSPDATKVEADRSMDALPTSDQAPKKWQPTEAEVRDLMATNDQVKGVLRRNVTLQLNKERELLGAKLKEEAEQQLSEKLAAAEVKAMTAKEQAVAMEAKKMAAKVNMTDNRFKNAQAKVDFVQHAAKETPEKPVGEVWSIAQGVKSTAPPAAMGLLGSVHAQETGPSAAKPATMPIPNKPTSAGRPATPTLVAGAPPSMEHSGPATTTPISTVLPTLATRTPAPSGTAPTGAPSTAPTNGTPSQGLQLPNRLPDRVLGASSGPRTHPPTSGPPTQRLPQSSLPMPSNSNSRSQGGIPITTGFQSRGGGTSHRGGGRGRGGIARGGGGGGGGGSSGHGIGGSQASIQTTNLPTHQGTAPLSATAKQFVPQKRAREDGGLEASAHAVDGKKQKGATGGAAKPEA